MGEDSGPESPAAMGLERGNLARKLPRREHVFGGSRMIRKCICEKYPDGLLGIHVPRMFCAVRTL